MSPNPKLASILPLKITAIDWSFTEIKIEEHEDKSKQRSILNQSNNGEEITSKDLWRRFEQANIGEARVKLSEDQQWRLEETEKRENLKFGLEIKPKLRLEVNGELNTH